MVKSRTISTISALCNKTQLTYCAYLQHATYFLAVQPLVVFADLSRIKNAASYEPRDGIIVILSGVW